MPGFYEYLWTFLMLHQFQNKSQHNNNSLKEFCRWNEPYFWTLYTTELAHSRTKSEAVCYSPSWEYSEHWIISSWVSTSHIGSEVCVPTREKKHETGLLPHLATSKSSGSSHGEDKNLEKWCMDIILAQKCPRTWKYQKKPWKIDNVVVIHTTYVITSS